MISGKTFGQIVARAAIERDPLVILAGDDPEAIVLDLMKPESSRRRAWGPSISSGCHCGRFRDQPLGAFDAERVALALDVAEDKIGSGHL
jgi:hypothetical protein